MTRWIALASLCLWTLVILGLTLLILPGPRPSPNLVPFRTIRHDWQAGGQAFVVNFAGNIIAFTPFGFLAPLARRGRTTWLGVGLAVTALSASIEVLQYLSGRRVGDVDDVLLNITGGLLGFGLIAAIRAGVGTARRARTADF